MYPIFARRITEPVTRKNCSFHVEGNIPLSEAILVLMSGTVPVPYIPSVVCSPRAYRLLLILCRVGWSVCRMLFVLLYQYTVRYTDRIYGIPNSVNV